MSALSDRAAQLAGRPVEVEETTDGKYIVLWMNLSHPPPPKGDTEGDALLGFIKMMERIKQEDTDGSSGDNVPDSQVIS
jgi:hypothetical protein